MIPQSRTETVARKANTTPVGLLMTLMSNGSERDRGKVPLLYQAQGLAEAYELAGVLFDSRRTRPAVVVSHGDLRAPYNIAHLAFELWPHADVIALADTATSQALCAALPTWMNVYRGGTRIFRPGADLSDEPDRHTLITPVWKNPDLVYDKVVRAARQAATRSRDDDPVIALARERAAHEATRAELIKLRKTHTEALRIADRPDTELPEVFSDPAVQFDHWLYNVWLETIPESDRERWPLRPYSLGPDFLHDLTTQQAVSRLRVMRCAVDVITGRYPEVPGREAKRCKPNPSGAAVIRPADGATAWRCYVQNTSPGMRLMWWEIDNEPELARVAVHDDYRMT